MTFLTAYIKWTMLVSGVLTCTMILAEVIVCNWGALIALVGGMLINGVTMPRPAAAASIALGRRRPYAPSPQE